MMPQNSNSYPRNEHKINFHKKVDHLFNVQSFFPGVWRPTALGEGYDKEVKNYGEHLEREIKIMTNPYDYYQGSAWDQWWEKQLGDPVKDKYQGSGVDKFSKVPKIDLEVVQRDQ